RVPALAVLAVQGIWISRSVTDVVSRSASRRMLPVNPASRTTNENPWMYGRATTAATIAPAAIRTTAARERVFITARMLHSLKFAHTLSHAQVNHRHRRA